MTAVSAALRSFTPSRIALLLLLLALAATKARAETIEVRLLVNSPPAEVRLRAHGWALIDAVGRSADAADCLVVLRGERRGARCGDEQLASPPLVLQPKTGPADAVVLEVGDSVRRYPGRLRFVEQNQALAPLLSIDREEYTTGVVLAECTADNETMLRLMAVCARSFAAFHRSRSDAPLADDTRSQMFRGVPDDERAKRVRASVEAVHDKVLRLEGKPAPAYYHACCGGQTRAVREVWPDSENWRHLHGVADVDEQGRVWCRNDRWFSWRRTVPADRFRWFLQQSYRSEQADREIENGPVTLDPTINPHRIDVWRFRMNLGRKLGWNVAPSDRFRLEHEGETVTLIGHGFGHRVGLCQAGALAQAEAGRSVEEILRFYFPGVAVE